jgi:hypothetical protein
MRLRPLQLLAAISTAIALSNLTGCAKGPVPVQGVVTLDGQPIAGAQVTFILDGADGEAPTGETDASGVFRVEVLPGNYKLLVVKKEIGPNMMKSVLPDRYADFANTPFTAMVPTAQSLELRLTRR